jgi:hypothetical protein
VESVSEVAAGLVSIDQRAGDGDNASYEAESQASRECRSDAGPVPYGHDSGVEESHDQRGSGRDHDDAGSASSSEFGFGISPVEVVLHQAEIDADGSPY